MRKVFLAAILAGVAIVPALAGELYENRTVGLSVEKPDGWHFLSVSEWKENLNRLDYSDEEFAKLLKERATAPLFAISKYPEPHPDLNPSFKITVRPLSGVTEQNLVEVVRSILGQMIPYLGTVDEISEPERMSLDGYPAAHTFYDYTIRTAAGQTFPVRSYLWVVIKDGALLLIGAGMRQDEANGNFSEIQSILATLELY